MFSKIVEIKSIREEKARLLQLETALSVPSLTDLNLIDTLYGWFREWVAERNCAARSEGVVQRKKFILVILLLYSPATLAGGKMAVGLRDKLAKVLDVRSRSTISDNCSDVVFFFNRYKSFRTEVEEVYGKLSDCLKAKGIRI